MHLTAKVPSFRGRDCHVTRIVHRSPSTGIEKGVEIRNVKRSDLPVFLKLYKFNTNETSWTYTPSTTHIVKCLGHHCKNSSDSLDLSTVHIINDYTSGLAFEYMHNGSIDDLIKLNIHKSIPDDVIGATILQSLIAINALDGQMKTLRPTKILINKQGVIKFNDCFYPKPDQRFIRHHLPYASPEMLQQYCSQPLGCWSYVTLEEPDAIWALGCIVFYMATLQHPFEYWSTWILSITQKEGPKIPQNVNVSLASLIKGMLAFERSERLTIDQVLASDFINSLFNTTAKNTSNDYTTDNDTTDNDTTDNNTTDNDTTDKDDITNDDKHDTTQDDVTDDDRNDATTTEASEDNKSESSTKGERLECSLLQAVEADQALSQADMESSKILSTWLLNCNS